MNPEAFTIFYNNCQWFETAKVDSESKREREGKDEFELLG